MKRQIKLTQGEDASGGGDLTVTIDDSTCFDSTIEGWRPLITGALTALGFHPENVKDSFGEVS